MLYTYKPLTSHLSMKNHSAVKDNNYNYNIYYYY